MKVSQKIAKSFYIPKLKKIEKDIGCRLLFNNIPERYIDAVMSCDMTKTWKKFGLNIEKGLNHFTFGKILNEKSTRFDINAPEYQSWLGGYSVKLISDEAWSFEDHFKLAIADQNSWLRRYGDPNPSTSIKGFEPVEIGKIQLGEHTGTLYESGCTTHSDVGNSHKTLRFLYGIYGMKTLYNLANKNLGLKAINFIPKYSDHPYEPVDLKGFIAIFNIKPKVKVVLYGNGTQDTFSVLKEDLLKAFESCEITTEV